MPQIFIDKEGDFPHYKAMTTNGHLLDSQGRPLQIAEKETPKYPQDPAPPPRIGDVPDPEAAKRSVVRSAQYQENPHSTSFVFEVASVADDIEPWGRNLPLRDQQLRQFFPTEPILASAIYSVTTRNAAFSWTLNGPTRTVRASQDILHEANQGKGWIDFITKFTVDLLTQDNGAFIELIRLNNKNQESPVIGIQTLDSRRCLRTGMDAKPVIYYDRYGVMHWLDWWNVIPVSEFPSPIETMNGAQLCAVSRVLRASQFLRDISIMRREKASGSNPNAMYLVGGVSSQMITDAFDQHKNQSAQQGFVRYIKPLIVGSLDPTANIKVDRIDIKSLPEDFDEEATMRWYINQLSLGFGVDYQDFAPLPGRSLGSGAQSLILAMKASGKGPGLFMKMLEHLFNYHGVLPKSVDFLFDEKDVMADQVRAQAGLIKAQARGLYVQHAILPAWAIQQQMVDEGDISQELFDEISETPDITEEVTSRDNTNPAGDVDDTTIDDEESDTTRGQKRRKTLRRKVRPAATANFDEGFRREQESAVRLAMKRALASMFDEIKMSANQKSVLFRKAAPDLPNLPDDPEFWKRFKQEMTGAMAPFVRNVAMGAARHNLDIGLAVNLDQVNNRVLSFSKTYLDTWWAELEPVTRDGLRQAIVNWQQGGLGNRGLPDLVDSLEPLFGEERAQRIATTEVTRLFDEGNRLAHENAGIQEEEWQTANDELVCPTCGPLNGQRFPTNSGPRPVDGTHINCRCARLPVANNVALRG